MGRKGKSMSRETYKNRMEFFEARPGLRRVLIAADKVLTRISYIAYPLLLVWLAVQKDPQLLRAVLVPGISFVILSCFRYLYCAPRPYEVYGIPSAVPKNTKGKSFPSRHVFSAFIIGMTFLRFLPGAGAVLLVLGAVMAVLRVAGGVHFPKDVLAGAVFGLVCGLAGFYWMPF